MKIAFVINDLNIGGAEKLVHDIANALVNLGEDISIILTLGKSETPLQKTLDPRIQVIRLPGRNKFSIRKICALSRLIKQFDVVHVNLFPSFYLGYLSSYFSRETPLLYSEHSTNNRRRGKKTFKIIEKYVYGRYQSIIAISNAAKKELLKWQPRITNKIITIENGIDFDFYNTATPVDIHELIPELTPGAYKVISVANFRPLKDHETVIRAIYSLPDNVHLILVGDGETKEKCCSLVHKLGMDHRVHFLGFQEDVSGILKACDLFILSSKWEGFGLSAVEAMAAGLPVVVSELPGVSQVVGDAALKFNPGNVQELSMIVRKLIDNPDLGNELKIAGLNRAGMYDIHKVAEAYKKHFYQHIQ